jgi:epoxyqueuosine reductase QueG
MRIFKYPMRFQARSKLGCYASASYVQSDEETFDMGPMITVCDKCLRACCWQGILMCDEAQTAGTVKKTKLQLKELNLESPDYWRED